MFFLESPVFWGIVGIIGVAVGIIGSYLPNRKVIKYHVACTKIITASETELPGLMVKLDDKPIQSLMVTTITFQNVGFQPIRSSDIAQIEPLGAHISGECFKYTLSSSNLKSGLTATQTRTEAQEGMQDGCTLNLHFDFLKRKDYFKMCLWHDGAVSPRGELISGKLKKDDKDKKDLIWCIFMELMYAAGIAISPLYVSTIIPAMIQSCDWLVPSSVLETVLCCVFGLLLFAWDIIFTIANVEAFHQ